MFAKITKKVFRCPQCTQKLRVPIKLGKTLRVTCNKCQVQFDVSYRNSIFELLQWEKGRTLKYNFEGINLRFKAMEFKDKLNAVLTLVIAIVFFNLVLIGLFNLVKNDSKSELKQILLEKNDHYEVI